MSASKQEIQAILETLLEALGLRMRAGSIEVHFTDDGIAQRVEVHQIPWRRRAGEPESTSPLVRKFGS